MKSHALRWALVGLGLQGERLAQAMTTSSSALLTAVVSIDSKRAKMFAEKFGVETFDTSLMAILKNASIDAVCIASPNDRHAKEIIQIAKSGMNIFSEKPLALTLREARRIEHALKKSRSRLFVNFILRMSSEVQKAREAIARGDLGDITYIELHWSIGTKGKKTLPPLPEHMQWREHPAKAGGGALVARGVHLFDVLRFITRKEVAEVQVLMDSTEVVVDRTLLGNFLLDDGTPVHILTSKVIVDADNHLAFFGTNGSLVIRDIFDPESWNTFNVRAFDELPKAFAGENTNLATLADGIATVAIMEAVHTSHKKKRVVSLRSNTQ